MIISDLFLKSFRAHTDTHVQFNQKVNAVCGPNGAGKTNLLEAIHYLCLSKSFVASADSYALRRGDAFFELRAQFVFDSGKPVPVRVVYMPTEGKTISVNATPLARLSEVVGRFPCVILSPEDHGLTAGGPEERRRFIDNILCQAHPLYLADLLVYRRALRQRNSLLRQAAAGRNGDAANLVSWTDKVVTLGARLIYKRAAFIEHFGTFLAEAYTTIENVAEQPSVRYLTLAAETDRGSKEDISRAFREKLSHAAAREREQGRTAAGPHRDELRFALDGLEVRRYASQGQHRTFALALRLAQYFYLRDTHDEMPLLLLDDVLDNLDPMRRAAILDLLQSDRVGQTIITAADRRLFDGIMESSDNRHSLIEVLPGDPVTVHFDRLTTSSSQHHRTL